MSCGNPWIMGVCHEKNPDPALRHCSSTSWFAPSAVRCQGINEGRQALYHEDVFTVYADSGHGQKRTIGHLEAPACPDCHRSHDVTLASLDKPLMEACLGCHLNTHNKHRKWLPNVFAHFEALACSGCHSPVSRDNLVVTIYDTGLKKNISHEDVTRRVGAKQIDQKSLLRVLHG